MLTLRQILLRTDMLCLYRDKKLRPLGGRRNGPLENSHRFVISYCPPGEIALRDLHISKAAFVSNNKPANWLGLLCYKPLDTHTLYNRKNLIF